MRREITSDTGAGTTTSVTMHDGSVVRFRHVGKDYDPTDRERAYAFVRECQKRGEVVTGLLYLDPNGADMHAVNATSQKPLVQVPFNELCPGAAALEELQKEFR
jgi:2-oxoglutarate ferredoxin oxidoreductase subunit beta